ncbi:hypothetical protein CcaverHIS002_0310330 [Cutaneotrichosporon cavernicola]|uniref:Uncharacterized protein n=1 Tax=Cutaneotrichosporon cavernicola TaxID=279322 RepID=A0AA48IJ48_9TREE|nr:uncharacterized protein CcaverHIS019_0310180 [Cutaneotrichosporon cavernicola]BEI83165.1 hypothetical protein CcaverHIS002_0310330 [Cutaneotrichosporon cavernicola]BEI90948.1 hypothetical protein CcaverHIS019_0310180 [Cutaneotrichosporon cavernicola]BEI98727.1 hypothetical protein CcaverHIS631_0310260 [Cutaneotrichosporon cavernicola]BEJ06499.1 hypothetical protein CcaverHIS641_0310210 [Cutaneotrichosporon cavernicola]
MTDIVLHSEGASRGRATRFRDLIHPPVIRQWIAGGKLYRERGERSSPRIELFLDLLYVGVVHQLADAAVESPSGAGVARFILTFWPSWSVWEEARRYSNVSGTDDLVHRVWVLFGMLCILGYTANASAIPLPGEAHSAAEEVVALLMRAEGAAAEGAAGAAGASAVVEDEHSPVRAAVAFFLVIKATRAVVLFLYAWWLPVFRSSQVLSGIAVTVPMLAYLPIIWVRSRRAQIGCAVAGNVLDLMRFDMILYNIYGRYLLSKRRREVKRQIASGELDASNAPDTSHPLMKMVVLPDHMRIPAINIEHSVDRSGAFTVLVLGELVANLLYIAKPGEYGVGHQFGKASLGFMVAWALNYMYTLPSDEHIIRYTHALRRSWVTGVLFNFFHWPLCASIVLAAAASSRMVSSDTGVEPGVKWFWGAGLGAAVLFLGLIDILHGEQDAWNVARIPRILRFATACVGAILLALFPLYAKTLDSTKMLALAVGITWAVLAVYVFGTLPKPGAILSDDETEAQPVVTVTDLESGGGFEEHPHSADEDYPTNHMHDDHSPEVHALKP